MWKIKPPRRWMRFESYNIWRQCIHQSIVGIHVNIFICGRQNFKMHLIAMPQTPSSKSRPSPSDPFLGCLRPVERVKTIPTSCYFTATDLGCIISLPGYLFPVHQKGVHPVKTPRQGEVPDSLHHHQRTVASRTRGQHPGVSPKLAGAMKWILQ